MIHIHSNRKQASFYPLRHDKASILTKKDFSGGIW